MKKALICTLAGFILSTTSVGAQAVDIEVPQEAVETFRLPSSFVFKGLYKSDHSLIFKADKVIFAQGSFNKKFSLKTPYGKQISTARLYELVPNNSPLFVIRDYEGYILGFVQLENYQRSALFKPVTGLVYDRGGNHIISAVFPLASRYCKFFAVQHDNKKFATTSKGVQGDVNIRFAEDYQELGIDSLLLASVLHIHASKSLLTTVANYMAIDEIEDMAKYARDTNGQHHPKSLPEKTLSKERFDEENKLVLLRDMLRNDPSLPLVPEEEKEPISLSLARKIDSAEPLLPILEQTIPFLSEEEKAVLLEIIDSRLDETP